jgi:hypothetical protein
MKGPFHKNSLDWQLQQLGRRFTEWQESLLPQPVPNAPSVPQADFGWLKGVLWLCLFGIVALVVYQLYRWLQPYLNLSSARQWGDRHSSTPPGPQSIADCLKQARLFQEQGNYREACRALYLAMLLRLHDYQLIPTDPSRTDGEYDRMVAYFPQADAYQTLLRTHEGLQFGNAVISQQQFNNCQQAYRQIEHPPPEQRHPESGPHSP